MKHILVFCGSSSGENPAYREKAYALGKLFAEKGIQLIYGGSKVGLMGIIAKAVLDHGGEVVGIIPGFLCKKEVVHDNLTELVIVDTLQERKQQMVDRCDGILTLPGGFGTLDELFEVLTWTQLGKINHPIGLLNWNGFFDHLLKQLQLMTDEGLLKPENQALLIHDTEAEYLIGSMESHPKTSSEKLMTQ